MVISVRRLLAKEQVDASGQLYWELSPLVKEWISWMSVGVEWNFVVMTKSVI